MVTASLYIPLVLLDWFKKKNRATVTLVSSPTKGNRTTQIKRYYSL